MYFLTLPHALASGSGEATAFIILPVIGVCILLLCQLFKKFITRVHTCPGAPSQASTPVLEPIQTSHSMRNGPSFQGVN